ncbi:hypothetical protein WJX81_001359 [Elliptochloris bilobata]|uniref:Ribosomal RNA-processing protein 40 n=1 Tax=Elliptochloris bilobata TaxID=381761 RepID=A0AAW1S3V9_9CHLO
MSLAPQQALASPVENTVVGPGDSVLVLPEAGQVRVGAGLHADGGHLRTTRPGILRRTKAGKLWVQGRQIRYIPAAGDAVVGTVVERHSDAYNVDLGGPFAAVLPALAFEGATRRNRPNLTPGDLVYARVTAASRDADPEITCTDASGKGAGFGPLQEGLVLTCSSALVRQLLASPPPPVVAALGAALAFELAVGQNGRVWVGNADSSTVVLVANALANSERLSPGQAHLMVKKLLASVQA